jgi:hypothetical protein
LSLSRDSRQERKLKAVRRAQFRLKQNIERIDWEEDFLTPEIEALKSGKSVLGLPEGMAFDIVIEHENQNPPAIADAKADGHDSDPADGS